MTMRNGQKPLDHGAEVEVDYDSIEIDFKLTKVPAVPSWTGRFLSVGQTHREQENGCNPPPGTSSVRMMPPPVVLGGSQNVSYLLLPPD